MELTTTIHHGPYESIPSTTSPGLRFLKSFLPAVDTLDPKAHPLSPFFTPDASILVCSNPPTMASAAIPLLEVRNRHLSYFHHQVHIAWDMDLANRQTPGATGGNAGFNPEDSSCDNNTIRAPPSGANSSKRTVMFEATSSTVFKNDPDEFAVKVREFNILDLEGPSDEILQVTEMRVFMDGKPVQARAQQLNSELAFGEGAREAEPS